MTRSLFFATRAVSLSCVLVGTILLVVPARAQYSQSPSSTKGCGIPVVVSTVPIPDPARLSGRWYKYRQSGTVTTNQYFEHSALNRTGLPYTLISATGILVQIEQYNNPDLTNCVHGFYVGMCGTNGQCPWRIHTSLENYAPSVSNFYMLYLDIDNVYILYLCMKANLKSGMCDVPSFHVVTRYRPDKMTADQVKTIDDVVDAVLAPYCFSAADIQAQQFTDETPFCSQIEYPTCVGRLVTALKQDIGNGTTN